jgi:ribonucleoside-diphosphate reductase alpha chain
MAKEGSTISGLMDTIATSVSIGLQYGVPLSTYVKKFSHMRFEPSGFSKHPAIGFAKSIVDYIFRWIGLKFLPENADAKPLLRPDSTLSFPATETSINARPYVNQSDAPTCPDCGNVVVRNGACYKCEECGTSLGCS